MPIHPTVAFFLAASISGSHLAGQLTWTPIPHVPTSRSMHSAAYDAERNQTVVHGGIGRNWSDLFADTWTFDGSTWTKRIPSANPPPRAWSDMVYDARRKRVVLFGGAGRTNTLGDTWEWDGTTWIDVTPASGNPPPRAGHALAYDSGRGRVLLFGGFDFIAGTRPDTWEWDGSAWQRVATAGPPGRAFHGMAYDQARGVTVLFGGRLDDVSTRFFGDTWEWNGRAWVERPVPGGPPARSSGMVAFDSLLDRTILFGGLDARFVVRDDTWAWDGRSWLPVEATGSVPPARTEARLTYDGARARMILTGGSDLLTGSVGSSSEYEIGTPTSSVTVFGTSCGAAPQIALAPAAGSRPALGTVFTLTTTHAPSRFAALMTAGVARTAPQTLDAIGMPGCFLYHSFEASWLIPVRGGTGNFSLAIPWHLPLTGQKIYFQSATMNVSSNGVEAQIGVR